MKMEEEMENIEEQQVHIKVYFETDSANGVNVTRYTIMEMPAHKKEMDEK